MRKPIQSVLAALLTVLAAGTSARADDEELFTYGSVEPNVMILFDSSGSMSELLCTGSVCETRWVIAKRTVNTLLDNISGVRLGLMKFRSNGAAMLAPVGTAKATVQSLVNSMTQTSVGTPLGDSLYDSGRYFAGTYTGYASPIQYSCQKNYVILITDGEPNNDSRDPVSNVSQAMYTTDHSSTFAGLQKVVTHTIGINIAAAAALLQATASNGGGQYAGAENAAEIYTTIGAAFASIIADNYSFSTPTIPSMVVSGSDKVFLASFRPRLTLPTWPGFLKAFTKGAGGAVPTDPNTGLPLVSSLVWDASSLLSARAPSSRTITTVVAGAEQSFVTTNTAITAAALAVATTAERDKMIEFVRGTDKYDEDIDGNTTEDRQFKLGDIFHSTPLLLFPPPAGVSYDPNYAAFQSAAASRTRVVITGANDGMLHAFNEATGAEEWGFIPPDALDDLVDMTVLGTLHPYFVDGAPVAADVKTNGAWRTLALFGGRRGGRQYHALDLTNTTDPNYLWSFSHSRLGETWSVPAIGKVRMDDGTSRYVAFAGGGYDSASNNATGNSFFVIDLADGSRLWEYYNTGTGSNDDRQMNFSIPATPTILDLDQDGYVDRIYMGDVGGQLWKFDVSAPAAVTAGVVTNWTGKRLFAAVPAQANPPPAGPYAPAQAIYGSPAVARDVMGNLWVYIGTGDRNRVTSTSTNRFYGIKDNTTMANGATLTESDLVNVTSTDVTATQGWYFTLASTEKVIGGADVAESVVYFSSFTPTSTVTCTTTAGVAQLYAIQMNTGYAALDWNNHDYMTSSDSSEDRSETVGEGLPTEPSIFLEDGTATVVVGTSTGGIEQVVVPVDVGVQVLYWREVY